jgi:hypothetical protein
LLPAVLFAPAAHLGTTLHYFVLALVALGSTVPTGIGTCLVGEAGVPAAASREGRCQAAELLAVHRCLVGLEVVALAALLGPAQAVRRSLVTDPGALLKYLVPPAALMALSEGRGATHGGQAGRSGTHDA